jgi:murein L,D-transpeptidase YcbB/YkuD
MGSSVWLSRLRALSSGASLVLLATVAGAGCVRAEDSLASVDLKSSISAESSPAFVIPLPDDVPDGDAAVNLTAGPAADTTTVAAQADPAPLVVDIPPPDLPPVEVVIDVPAAPAAVVAMPEPPEDTPIPLIASTAAGSLTDSVAAVLEKRLEGEGAAPLPSGKLGKRDRALLAQFYQGRAFKPLFIGENGLNEQGRGVVQQVSKAELDGLDPAAYALPHLSGAPAELTPERLADGELALAVAAFDYARDARGGRIDPTRLSSLMTPDMELPKAGDVLEALADAPDSAAVLAGYQPRHAGYRALREKLAELRESTGALSSKVVVPDGRPLRIGMSDARVPALRARLGVPAQADDVFDETLSDALAAWQKQEGLRPTGRLERGMAVALNGRTASSAPIADIVANMERWRWLPQDLGGRHIEVNLPEYTLRVVDNGKVIHQARVIVGKPETPTPIFSNRMQMVIVNPYWHIPPSIMKNEILPKLAADPNYATDRGYEVVYRGNSISVRQPPGERNALGFIKFLFPNQHSVYLHDTPTRGLFARQERAFSHGCVRVDQPFRLGEIVLGADGYDEQRLRKMIGSGERTIKLKQELPIHLTYFTLFVDEAGRLQRREDIYGYDAKVRTALGIHRDGSSYAQLR